MPENQNHSAEFSRLLAGDPGKECASFTRFVLPFAYRPLPTSETSARAEGEYWREATPSDWIHKPEKHANDTNEILDRSRRRYLTREIETVLFERANWFVLGDGKEKEVWHEIDFTGKKLAPPSEKRPKGWTGGMKVNLRPPALVLFEWPQKGATGCCEGADELHTGLLIIEAWFTEIPSLADLLHFNELFRYWRKPYENHEADCPGIVVINAALGITGTADDDYTARWHSLLKNPVHGMDGSLQLETRENPDAWRIHADDRAFVSACVIVKHERDSDDERPLYLQTTELPLDPLRSWGNTGTVPDNIGAWIKVLNVDGPRSPGSLEALAGSSVFEREWMQARTYRRWLHCGTAYGYTAHSAAMLSAPCDDAPFWRHFGQMYFDQLLLMLYLRTTLFRFSQSLSEISAKMRDELVRAPSASAADFHKSFLRMRLRFDLFTNLYQFPLLSNQQQAVEMYAIMREQLDIKAIYDEIHAEIDGTDEVIELQNQDHLNRLAALLGVIGLVGVAAGVAQVILSAWNDGPDNSENGPSWFLWIVSFCASIPFFALAGWLVFRQKLARRPLWLGGDPEKVCTNRKP